MKMKRKMKLLCATICAFAISTGMGIATASFTSAHAAENFEMLEGASIRYASESGTNGLRFTATVPAAEYVEGATYGVLIAPEDYVAKNPLDYENVFGENAVYDWAVRNENGEYVYNGTKTRIINIVYDELNANSEGDRILNGSILNIKDGNLSRNFVGRAYVKNGDSYTLADYATVDGVSGAAHNTRSALEVAQRAYFSGSSFTAEQQETIDHYMGNSANYSAASLAAGDDYVLFVDKYATSYETGEKLSSNLSLHAELADDSLPAGYSKAYRLNCDYTAAGDYKIFNNLDKDGYTRLKFYIKLEQDGNGNKTGGYSIPFRGRNDDKQYEWVPVEYVKKAGGSWSVYYEDTEITACPADRVFGLDMNGFVCVTEVLGVKDARDEVYTVTYKNSDGEVIKTEAVRKGRAALGGEEDLGDGYTINYVWTTENGGTAEADLSAITANITVYGSSYIVYRTYERPNYTNVMTINKYVKADDKGNIEFKVRVRGADNKNFTVYATGGWTMDYFEAGGKEGVWYTVRTEATSKTVYVYDENGAKLVEKVFEEFDVTTMSICANHENTTTDIAAISPKILKKYTVTYIDIDGKVINSQKVEEGESASFVPASYTDSEGYIYEYNNVKWLVSEDGAEADLSAVTSDIAVYFGGNKLVYKNVEKPNYTSVKSINDYVKADSEGSFSFKVRLHGNGAAFWIYEKSGGWNANSVGQWAEVEKWYTVVANGTTKIVSIYDENGNKLTNSGEFPELSVNDISICTGDNPNTDVAVDILPEVTVTYLDTDGSVISVETINKGDSAVSFVPEARTDDEGYVHEYTNACWLVSEGGAEADLSSVTANTTVYYGGDKLIYKNVEQPNYTSVKSINKYLEADSEGNFSFKVRLHGKSTTFWIYEKSGGWNANCEGQSAEVEKWYTVVANGTDNKIYIYDENGNLQNSGKEFPELSIETISVCANDNPNTDIAVTVSQKKNDITTLLVEKTYKAGASQTSEDGRVYQYAVEEFVNLYRDMTGTTLDVVYVDGVNDKLINGKRFVLGSSFAKAEGVTCEDLYTDTGYAIKKQNGNVYLFGNTGYGTLNAVYAFLNEAFGLEFYSDEVYSVSRTGEFDYEALSEKYFNPSIDYNWAHGPIEYRNKSSNFVYQYRLGYVNYWQILQGSYHNAFDVLPAETYQADHPNWYTDASKPEGGTFDTLNLAYGLTEADNGEMAGTVAKYIYDDMMSQVKVGIVKEKFVFSLSDMWGWSASSESAALKTKYGSYSAEYILFMKKVAQVLAEKYTFGRNIHLVLMAYNASFTAPTKNLSDLTFYNNGEISMDVMFAPIEANHYRAVSDTTGGRSENSDVANGRAYIYEQSNADFWAELPKWKALLNGGDLMCFDYSAHYDNYFAPLDSISNMGSRYAALADNGVKHLYNLGQAGDDVSTDWTALKLYLEKKFAENAYRTDLDELIEKFCNAYFGAAGSTMHELYNAYAKAYKEASEYWVSAKGNDPMGCHLIRKYAFDKNAWGGTDAKLLALYAKIETALSQVEQNSAEYKRIQVEGITYRYLLAGVFENTTYGTIAEIATDAKNLGIDIFCEGSPYTATPGASGDHYNTSNKIEDLA